MPFFFPSYLLSWIFFPSPFSSEWLFSRSCMDREGPLVPSCSLFLLPCSPNSRSGGLFQLSMCLSLASRSLYVLEFCTPCITFNRPWLVMSFPLMYCVVYVQVPQGTNQSVKEMFCSLGIWGGRPHPLVCWSWRCPTDEIEFAASFIKRPWMDFVTYASLVRFYFQRKLALTETDSGLVE